VALQKEEEEEDLRPGSWPGSAAAELIPFVTL